MAVGGVDIAHARDYIDAGALAVGIGSPLLRGADRGPGSEALAALTGRARALLAAVGAPAEEVRR
jgi:2-dehydro-3-deoxyphosphogluconate aldolase/(4S)-4-hydroxy-2-oxoglutarate aldolase